MIRTGKLYWTPGIRNLMANSLNSEIVQVIGDCLNKHEHGDWGIVSDEDKKLNDEAVENGFRVLSAYKVDEKKIWIITEADRESTTILLPEEY